MSITITSPVAGANVTGVVAVSGSTVQSVNGVALASQAYNLTADMSSAYGLQTLTVSNGVDVASVQVIANVSPDGATIPSNAQIVDPLGNVWTLVGGQVMENGGGAGVTTGATLVLLFTSQIYYSTGSAWFSWNGINWSSIPQDPRLPTESPNGTTIPSATSVIDAAGATWTVVSGVVKKNGANAGFTTQVVLLLYYNHIVYQQNQPGNWWNWVNNAWVATTDPRAPAGTLTVTQPTAGEMTGTFCTVSGTSNQSSVVIADGTTTLASVTPDTNGNWSKQVMLNRTVGAHTINVTAGSATPVAVAVTCGNPLPAKIFYGMNGHLAWGSGSWSSSYTKANQLAYLQDLGVTMYRADVAESTMAGVIKAQLVSGGTFYNKGIGFLVCLNGTSMGWNKGMSETASYNLTKQRAIDIGNTLNGFADYFELGNELDQFIRSASTPGNGSQNNNWDTAGFKSLRGAYRGMYDGLKSVNPDFQCGMNIAIPMATALVQMLWDGTDPSGATGAPVLRGDYLNWHWYGSSGDIEKAGGSLNIPQYIKDHFNTPWFISEWGWASGVQDQTAQANYTTTTMTQYANLTNFRNKYGLAGIYQYVLIDPTYGLIASDGTTKHSAYNAVKNFIAANPV